MTQHYSLIDELMADAVAPLDAEKRNYTMAGFLAALEAIEKHPEPTKADWRVLSDCVNLTESLIDLGEIDGREVTDAAVAAMAAAARRKVEGGQIRFDGPGLAAMRALVEDFGEVLKVLPARVMIRSHRHACKRLKAIKRGKRRPGDKVITM